MAMVMSGSRAAAVGHGGGGGYFRARSRPYYDALMGFLNAHCSISAGNKRQDQTSCDDRKTTHCSTSGKFQSTRAGAFSIPEQLLSDLHQKIQDAVDYDGWDEFTLSEMISDLESTPVVVDIDIMRKIAKDNVKPGMTEEEITKDLRSYSISAIMELMNYYVTFLKQCIVDDGIDPGDLEVYIMEKKYPTIERATQPRGQIMMIGDEPLVLPGSSLPCKLFNDCYYEVKDGVHIVMPRLVVKKAVQLHVRQKLLEHPRVREILESFGSQNGIECVFDRNTCVSSPWPLYGSRKQKHKLPYLVTMVYTMRGPLNDPSADYRQQEEGVSYDDNTALVQDRAASDNAYLMNTLSLRNKCSHGYGGVPIRPEIIKALNDELQRANRGRRDQRAPGTIRGEVTRKDTMELKSIIQYVKCLNSARATSRNTWLQVGWCLYNLHNADNTLLNAWIAFSKKSECSRHVLECEEACAKEWSNMRIDSLGMGSLKLWAQQDDPEEYEKICRDDIYHKLKYSKMGRRATARDFAELIYTMYKDHHICINVLKNIWYYYDSSRHIWVRDDGAAELDRVIPDEVWSRINYICDQELIHQRYNEFASAANSNPAAAANIAALQFQQSMMAAAALPSSSSQPVSSSSQDLSQMPEGLRRLYEQWQQEQAAANQQQNRLAVRESQTVAERSNIVGAQLSQQIAFLEAASANAQANAPGGAYGRVGPADPYQGHNRIMEFKKKLDDIRETGFKGQILKECKTLFYHTERSQNFICNLDTNTNLIVCKNGVLDLLVNEMRNGRPEDYMSLSTKIEYRPLKEHDRNLVDAVDRFLESIYIVEDVREYVKYIMSTFITGSTKNESFAVLTGRGSNGKSKIFKLIAIALGEYAKPIGVVIFTSKRPGQGQATPDLAQLKGVRIAMAEEPELNPDGSAPAINGGIIKEVTGDGAGLNVRPLYSENVVIKVQTKLLLGSNHKLRVDSADDAIRRRLHNVEHVTRFLNEDTEYNPDDWMHFMRNNDLDIDSWGEVFLSMLVDTHLYYKKNQKPLVPAEIQHYSKNYFNMFDEIKQFWDEFVCTTHNPNDFVENKVLYAEYKQWFQNERDRMAKPMTIEKFTYLLKRKHDNFVMRGKKVHFRSIRLRQLGEEDDEDFGGGGAATVGGSVSAARGVGGGNIFAASRSMESIDLDRLRFKEKYGFDVVNVPTFVFLKFDWENRIQTILYQGAQPLHRAVRYYPSFIREYLHAGDYNHFRFGVLVPPENEDSARVVKLWTLTPLFTQQERVSAVRSGFLQHITMFKEMLSLYVYQDETTGVCSERNALFRYRHDYKFSEVMPPTYIYVFQALQEQIESGLTSLETRLASHRAHSSSDEMQWEHADHAADEDDDVFTTAAAGSPPLFVTENRKRRRSSTTTASVVGGTLLNTDGAAADANDDHFAARRRRTTTISDSVGLDVLNQNMYFKEE